MLEPANQSTESHQRRPVCSIVALCCPALLFGLLMFLQTPQGHRFSAGLFERYFTAGPVLMLAVYGALWLCLGLLGLVFTVIAFIRREKPRWLPWLAVAANVFAELVVLSYIWSGLF
jgi:hypothetical protein